MKQPYMNYEELPKSSPLDQYFDIEKLKKENQG